MSSCRSALALLALLATGCTFFTIEDVALPQSEPTVTMFNVPGPAAMTWRGVREIARQRPVAQQLVLDDALQLASWTEEQPLEACATRKGASGAIRKKPMIALNTVWVRAQGEASRLHVRRICFPTDDDSITRSNGIFEVEFAMEVLQHMIDELKSR